MVTVLLLGLAMGALVGAGETPPPGTPIVSVRVERHDVFDTDRPGTSAWPYRAANALHVLTRESYIRSLLLFKVGDPLDPALLAESARLIRTHGAVNPVHITAHTVAGGAEVVVETHDQWSTEVGVNYGHVGNRGHFGFSLSEENFLGHGREVELDYQDDDERRYTTVVYKDPLLLGRRLRLRAEYRDASDGSRAQLRLEQPFFSLATSRAGGLLGLRDSRSAYLWSGGSKVVEGHVRRRDLRLWHGLRVPGGGDAVDRLRIGAFARDARFSAWGYRDGRPFESPADYTMVGLEVGWERQADRWEVVQGFRAWQRQEDVPLGPNWSVQVGLSLPALGADSTRVLLDGELTVGTLTGRQFTWFTTFGNGRLERGHLANGLLHGELGTARTGPVGWRARLAFDLGHDLDRDRQLTLGADRGLRGWDPDTFDGTSRVVANLEARRRLTGEILHLAILGAGVFLDGGRTWAPRVGPDTDGWRGDAGIGLLAELTHASIVRVIRVEVAWSDRGGSPVFLVTGTNLFFPPREDWED